MSHDDRERSIYGLMAEFDDPDRAGRRGHERAHAAGYRRMDAYSPFPVEGLHGGAGRAAHAAAADRARRRHLSAASAAIGCSTGSSVIAYPLNIGGRPLHSWPAFIPVTFECTVLGAALSAVLGMLALNGLPQPYHPVFNVPRVRAGQPRIDSSCASKPPTRSSTSKRTREFLTTLGPREVSTVADSDEDTKVRRHEGARRCDARLASCVALCPLCGMPGLRGCRQDMHDQPKYVPLRESDVLRRWPVRAAARGGNRRARTPARRRAAVYRQEPARQDATAVSVPDRRRA